jgi:hypothetical protein
MVLTGGKPKYLDGNVPQCLSVHHKSHIACPRTDPWPPQSEASERVPELQKLSRYLKDNTLHVHYEDQSVNIVLGNNFSLS